MLTDILSRFSDVRSTGEGKWQAKCPAHDDDSPSLAITRGDSKWLLYCHANCKTDDVLSAAGLTYADLGDGEQSPPRSTSYATRETEYKYQDADGRHIYSAIRQQMPNGKKKFLQRRADGEWSMRGVKRLLYNLPAVIKADTVFIVEGEKDVETLRNAGLTATCNVGGAGKWLADYSQPLEGKTVFILPDNDQAGIDHANRVQEMLGFGKIVSLPLGSKGNKRDVTDWFESGGSREQLEQLCRELSEPDFLHRAGSILADYLNEIRSGELPQLLQQHTALQGIEVGPGLITVVGAPPGQGKTALAMQVMYDALELQPDLNAVVANAEMSFQTLLRRELTRMTRIASSKIRFGNLSEYELADLTDAASELLPRLDRVKVIDPCNLTNLGGLCAQPPGLVIVDYLQKFAPPDKDARQGVNEVMAALRSLAATGWAVLCLSATKRDSKGRHDSSQLGLSSFRESGDIEYNADSAYVMVDEGPVDEETEFIRKVTLKHVKNRHDRCQDRELSFHKPRMEFSQYEAPLVPLPEFLSSDDSPVMPWDAEANQ